MKTKNISRKIVVLSLCSLFVSGAMFDYSFAADKTTTDSSKIEKKADEKTEEVIPNSIDVIGNNSNAIEAKMPKSKTLDINVTSMQSGSGYLAVDISSDMLVKNKDKEEALLLQSLKGNDVISETKLMRDYGSYSADSDHGTSMYRFFVPTDSLENTKLRLINKNKEESFNKEFKIRITTYNYEKDMELFKSTTLTEANLKKNNVESRVRDEKKKVYKGFVFGNLDGEKVDTFIFRPDSNASKIRINFGSDESGFRYDNRDIKSKFDIEYFNNEETFRKIEKNGYEDDNGKNKYDESEYKRFENESVQSNRSVTVPWYPKNGIIKITLKNPNTFLFTLSVEDAGRGVNINNPTRPSESGGNQTSDNSTSSNEGTIDSKVKRYSGGDRYDTAIKLSKESFSKSDVAVVASGENFADALSGSSFAAINEAPLLLVNESNANRVKNELDRLDVEKVYILGGKGSISNNVEYKLTKKDDDENRETIRLAGKNRFETSIEVYKEFTKMKDSKEDPILVNGNTFPDALSAGTLGAKLNRAVVLTDGHNLNSRLSKNNSKNIIIGGYNSMDSSFKGYRYNGKDRYETSALLAKEFKDNKKVILASGEKYPDGLASISLYHKYEAPLLLTQKNNLPKVIKNYITSNDIENTYIVGGTNSVSSKIENMFK